MPPLRVRAASRVQPDAAGGTNLAIAIAKGQQPTSATGTITDPESKKEVKSVLLTPVSITKDNVKDVITDGFVTKEELCTADYAKACTDAGIS